MKKGPEKQLKSLKTQKTSLTKDYKKFEDIKDRYTTKEGLTKALGITKDLWKKIEKKPKFNVIVDKIKSLTFNGLSALIAIEGITISRRTNLINIKRKLKGFKRKLQSTYKNWVTKHGELVRIVDIERKRLELISSYEFASLDKIVLEIVEVTSSDPTLIADIDTAREDLTDAIKSNPLYLDLRKKIETASADEILYMHNDPTLFTDFEKDLNEVIITEFKRLQVLELINAYAFSAPTYINFINTEEDFYNAYQEILETDDYTKLIQGIHADSYEDLVAIENDPEFFQKHSKDFQLIGYHYINKKRLDQALEPYLELKPNEISKEQFRTVLEYNNIYKTAVADINERTLIEQKSFDPKEHIDFNKEKEIKPATPKQSPTNMYQFALLASKIIPSKILANGNGKSTDFDNLS